MVGMSGIEPLLFRLSIECFEPTKLHAHILLLPKTRMPPLFWRQIIRDFVVLLLSQTPTATRLGACNGDASLQRLLHDLMIPQLSPFREIILLPQTGDSLLLLPERVAPAQLLQTRVEKCVLCVQLRTIPNQH